MVRLSVCPYICQIIEPNFVLTIQQPQLQQGGQSSDDHKHEKAAPSTHQADSGAQRHAGRHCNDRFGVKLYVEVVGHDSFVTLGVHKAAHKAVMDPVAC